VEVEDRTNLDYFATKVAKEKPTSCLRKVRRWKNGLMDGNFIYGLFTFRYLRMSEATPAGCLVKSHFSLLGLVVLGCKGIWSNAFLSKKFCVILSWIQTGGPGEKGATSRITEKDFKKFGKNKSYLDFLTILSTPSQMVFRWLHLCILCKGIWFIHLQSRSN
jgi:hypothetical protein